MTFSVTVIWKAKIRILLTELWNQIWRHVSETYRCSMVSSFDSLTHKLPKAGRDSFFTKQHTNSYWRGAISEHCTIPIKHSYCFLFEFVARVIHGMFPNDKCMEIPTINIRKWLLVIGLYMKDSVQDDSLGPFDSSAFKGSHSSAWVSLSFE